MDNNNDINLGLSFVNWDLQSKKLKEKFGELTLSDVTISLGNENEMLNRIQKRLNKSRYQLICILKSLSSFQHSFRFLNN